MPRAPQDIMAATDTDYSARWAELTAYVGFREEHARTLEQLRPYVSPHFPKVVEAFYEAIERTPGAIAVFVGGAEQIARQKGALSLWLKDLFSGTYDQAYLQRHVSIGRTHVAIGLPQRYMFGAMSLVRQGLQEGLEKLDPAVVDRTLACKSIDLICELELAIMLETYSDHMGEQMRSQERLATLGQLAGFVGHELRNPLAVMETSLHLLGKRLSAPDERARRHLQRLSEQVSLSSGIIAGLLELTRDRAPERHPVFLAEALERAINAAIHGVANHDQIRIQIDIDRGTDSIFVDPTYLHHLLVNLISNAAQAIAEKSGSGAVTVRSRADGTSLFLEVEDDGPGLKPEVLQTLFEPLRTTRTNGMGLGLALCRKIAEKHGGEIEAENRTQGGALFRVRLADAVSKP